MRRIMIKFGDCKRGSAERSSENRKRGSAERSSENCKRGIAKRGS